MAAGFGMRGMRERVSLVRIIETDDGVGGQNVQTTRAATFWADWDPKYGAEFLQAGAVQVGMRHLVRIRYRTDVSVNSKVYLEPSGPTCNVVQVVDVGRRHQWLLLDVIEDNRNATEIAAA